MATIRETFFEVMILNEDKKVKWEDFFHRLNKVMGKNREIKLPMQLIEKIFEFDFHRGVHHPIASNITYEFKKRGFRITKVRNKYQARIRKIK